MKAFFVMMTATVVGFTLGGAGGATGSLIIMGTFLQLPTK